MAIYYWWHPKELTTENKDAVDSISKEMLAASMDH
jgi:hypothetical protein